MTNAALKSAIAEAAALKQELEQIEAAHKADVAPKYSRLEELKALIGTAAADRPKLATETAGGGLSWNFTAPAGGNVRVTQPAAKLISAIEDAKLIEKLRAVCGGLFATLFVTSYKRAGDTKKWRELAYRTLPNKADAEKVIALCELPSTPSVTIG